MLRKLLVGLNVMCLGLLTGGAILAACAQKCRNLPTDRGVGYKNPVTNNFICTQWEHEVCNGCRAAGETSWCDTTSPAVCTPILGSWTRRRTGSNACTLLCTPGVSENISQEATIDASKMGIWQGDELKEVCRIH